MHLLVSFFGNIMVTQNVWSEPGPRVQCQVAHAEAEAITLRHFLAFGHAQTSVLSWAGARLSVVTPRGLFGELLNSGRGRKHSLLPLF